MDWAAFGAVAGLGVACAAWVAVQQYVKRRDPDQPGVEGWQRCGHHGEGEPLTSTACGDCPQRGGKGCEERTSLAGREA